MNTWKSLILRGLAVLAGALICATGINLLLVPEHLLPGGVSGIAALIQYLTGLPMGLTLAVLNIPLFVIAWRRVDLNFAILSLVGLIGFSGGLILTAPLADLQATSDPIMAAIYGGVMSGVGGGLALRFHGSLAGLDIVGVLLRQILSTSVASAVLLIDLAIVLAQSFIYGMDLALLTLTSMAAATFALDRTLTGFGRSKAVFVITDRSREIVDTLMERLGRGATLIEGEGAWTQHPKRIVYCVVTQRQLAPLKRVVEHIDPGAFVTVLDTTEVVGEGFIQGPAG